MSRKSFKIGNKTIGVGNPAFLIAEIAQAHDGSLGLAHSFIDLAAEIGADAVKFQTHIAEAETTPLEEWRVKFSYLDETRYEYWKRMEFTTEEWAGLARHAKDKKLIFLSSAFSFEAVDLLKKLEMPAWKIASGETTNTPLIDYMCKTGKPILLSTGMSTAKEITQQVEHVRGKNVPIGIFQCTSKYPTVYEDVGVNVMEEMAMEYNCPVGLSDHSGEIYPDLYAMARGASMIESHICFHKTQFGPDTKASLDPAQFKEVVKARDAFYAIASNPIQKENMSANIKHMRKLFGKSVSVKKVLKKGTVLTDAMLTAKKPGTGVPAANIQFFVGKKLKRDIAPTELLSKDDVV